MGRDALPSAQKQFYSKFMQELNALIPQELQRRLSVVPLAKHGSRLMVGVQDSLSTAALEELRIATNCKIVCLKVNEQGAGVATWESWRVRAV